MIKHHHLSICLSLYLSVYHKKQGLWGGMSEKDEKGGGT